MSVYEKRADAALERSEKKASGPQVFQAVVNMLEDFSDEEKRRILRAVVSFLNLDLED